MCAWRPRQTNLGNQPNILYIIHKPEPISTEFKRVCCPITGVTTYIEIQRGKEGMKNMRLQEELGTTASYTVRCAEGFHKSGEGLKASVKGDACFGSIKYAVALAYTGRAFFGQFRSNHGLFPKYYIEEALKEAPSSTNIVLKCTHQKVDLILLGYHYSSKRTLYFIFTSDAGSTT